MHRNVLIALVLLIVIIGGSSLAHYILPKMQTRDRLMDSDAAKIIMTLKGAVDDFKGYFVFFTKEFKNYLRAQAYNADITDDKANYEERFLKVHKGELDWAVATVGTHIRNGLKEVEGIQLNYPGLEAIVIDKSDGADGFLANPDVVKKLKEVSGKKLRIAYPQYSPPHTLLKFAASHFGYIELVPSDPSLKKEASAEDVVQLVLDGKADICATWEPHLTRGIKKGLVKIYDSSETEGVIVDVLLVNRDTADKHPEAIKALLRAYFQTLKLYLDDEPKLIKVMQADTDFSEDEARDIIKKIKWASFNENLKKWYRGGGLANSIDSIANVFVDAGDYTKNPLPDSNPLLLIKGQFLEDLAQEGFGTSFADANQEFANPLEAKFSALPPHKWDLLDEMDKLKVPQVRFSKGIQLSKKGMEAIDAVVDMLRHHRARLEIQGHTGEPPQATKKKKEQLKKLSEDRAKVVFKYLAEGYSVDPNRMRAVGFGSSRKLPEQNFKSSKDWERALPRVEFVLKKDNI